MCTFASHHNNIRGKEVDTNIFKQLINNKISIDMIQNSINNILT